MCTANNYVRHVSLDFSLYSILFILILDFFFFANPTCLRFFSPLYNTTGKKQSAAGYFGSD